MRENDGTQELILNSLNERGGKTRRRIDPIRTINDQPVPLALTKE